jgi:hypothetical protein
MSAGSVAEPGPLGGSRHAQRRVVLVPLRHGAPGHPAPLDRADLDNRSVAQHRPAGVDARVPAERQQGLGHRDHPGRDVVVGADRRSPLVELFEPGVLLALGVPQRLGGVAHRAAGPVGDDVGDLRGRVTAVVVVDELDDLFAPAGSDVQVHVAARRQSVQWGMACGWSGGEYRRDVPDDAFRRRLTPIVRSAAAGAPSAHPPRQAGSSVANMRVVFQVWASKACGGCRLRDDPAVKTKESSNGTFGEHG